MYSLYATILQAGQWAIRPIAVIRHSGVAFVTGIRSNETVGATFGRVRFRCMRTQARNLCSIVIAEPQSRFLLTEFIPV
ncbi:hypothetical protein X767_13090 [Mesorhizobium sp. LSJC264A00]|nr:hypothetical protein X767_13090 [Mesorhizobium sp. LSJC264A00]